MGPPSMKGRRASIDQGFAKVAPRRDWMTEAEEKVEKEIRAAKQRATLARRCVVVAPARRRPARRPPPARRCPAWGPPSVPADGPVGCGGLTRGAPAA